MSRFFTGILRSHVERQSLRAAADLGGHSSGAGFVAIRNRDDCPRSGKDFGDGGPDTGGGAGDKSMFSFQEKRAAMGLFEFMELK